MPGTLQVRLGDRIAGTITNLTGDSNLFAFDDDYAGDPARPVLSQSFLGPNGDLVTRVPRTTRSAPPFFANLLPEESNVLRALVAQQYGILDRDRDFPYLQALGADLPGAVVVRAPDVNGDETVVPVPSDAHATSERTLRFSLAGVQTKFSASRVGDRFTISVDGVGGSWIVKLPTNDYARLPENEYAVMSLGAAIGFNVPSIRLVSLDSIDGLPRDLSRLRRDEPRIAYAIQRFDRSDGRRIHGEDYNQIAGLMPRSKYDVVRSEWIAQVTNELCPPEDVDEFVKRLVFGILVGNGDMHAKNWSVQYPDGRNARLSPMYDFVCTRAYLENDSLALPIGGCSRFSEINGDAIASFARHAELPIGQTRRIAAEVVTRVNDAWRALKPTLTDADFVEALDRNLALVPLASGR